jgi:hypothetical protein
MQRIQAGSLSACRIHALGKQTLGGFDSAIEAGTSQRFREDLPDAIESPRQKQTGDRAG